MKESILIMRGQQMKTQMKSNEALLTIRHNLISVFKQYESIIMPVLRFIVSFSALRMLKEATTYNGVLSGTLVLIGLALIGSFASAEWIIIWIIFLTTFFVFPSNPILAVILFGVMCMIYILYARLFPKESIWIIVTLIAFSIKIEMLIPIIAALFGTYISILAIIIGVILWFAIPNLRAVMPNTTIQKDKIVDTMNQLLTVDYKALLADPNMMIIIVIFFIVFSAVYIIRKQSIDYGPYIAIGIGAAMNILGFGLTIIFFNGIDVNMIKVILETLLFSGIAVVMQFLSIALDYQRAETVSFEDNDNYYYVKIVPKIHLTHKHKTVKKVYTNLSHTSDFNHRIMEDDNISNGL